jgi:hypothetical protein
MAAFERVGQADLPRPHDNHPSGTRLVRRPVGCGAVLLTGRMRTEELHGIAAELGSKVVTTSVLAGGFSHETCLLTLADGPVVARCRWVSWGPKSEEPSRRSPR